MPVDRAIVYRVVDQTAKGLRRVEGNLKRAERSATGLAGKARAVGVAFGAASVAAVGVGVQAVKAFASVDKKVREVGTLMGDVSDEQLKRISDLGTKIATTTGQAAEEVLGGVYDAISAGVPEADVERFVTAASKFAVAGNTDIKSSVDLLTSSVNAFGLEATEVDRVSDVFFATVKQGKTTVGELGASFSNIGPVAGALGVSMEEVAGWMAQLTLSGTPTAQATTQIRAALAELAKPTSKVSMLFEDLTGQTFPKFIAGGGTLSQALEILDGHMVDTDRSALELFGSVEAGQAVLGATGANAENFSRQVDAIGSSSGAAATAFGVMSEGVSFKMDVMGEKVSALTRRLGEMLAPAVIGVVDALDHVADKLDEASEAKGENELRAMALSRAMETAEQKTTSLSFGTVALKGEYENLGEEADTLIAAWETQNTVYSTLRNRTDEVTTATEGLTDATMDAADAEAALEEGGRRTTSVLMGLGAELISATDEMEGLMMAAYDSADAFDVAADAAANMFNQSLKALDNKWDIPEPEYNPFGEVINQDEIDAAVNRHRRGGGSRTRTSSSGGGGGRRSSGGSSGSSSGGSSRSSGSETVTVVREEGRESSQAVGGSRSIGEWQTILGASSLGEASRLLDQLAEAGVDTSDRNTKIEEDIKKFQEVAAILGDAPKMARGGIVTRPTFAMLGESGPEAVVPLRGRPQPLTVVLELDGAKLGEVIVSDVNEAARKGTLSLGGSFTH